MLNFPKASKGMPLPDMGDFQLAFNIAQATFTALSNHVTGAATVQAAAGAPYSNGLVAPAITAKVSGKFIIWAQLSVAVNGGSLVDADSVSFQLLRGAVAIGPLLWTAASTATGATGARTVIALCEANGIIDVSGAAIGAATTYSLNIASTNAHTSGVVGVADGQITVLELPA